MAISTIGQNGLQQSRILTAVQQPAGAVLQVVQAVWNSGAVSTASTTYVSTGFSASITPTSASSKILITVATTSTNTTSSLVAATTVYRNSTNLGGNVNSALSSTQNTGTNYVWAPTCITYLDSPATTSSTTYTLYLNANSGGTSYVMWGAATSTITLMEIAA